jgi:selenocysteine-specific elongation factor
VRSLHVQNRKADRGQAGQRCALNLAGLAVDDIRRGDWLTGQPAPLPAQRLDIALTLAADAPRALAHGAVVQIHHGTRQLGGRVALLDAALEKSGLAPGGHGLAQLVADAPLHACRGDLVVLRDAHGRNTLGGGRILDPFGPRGTAATRTGSPCSPPWPSPTRRSACRPCSPARPWASTSPSSPPPKTAGPTPSSRCCPKLRPASTTRPAG